MSAPGDLSSSDDLSSSGPEHRDLDAANAPIALEGNRRVAIFDLDRRVNVVGDNGETDGPGG